MARSRHPRRALRQPARTPSARPTPTPRLRRERAVTGAVVGILLVLALLGDDRHVGLIADGRQMIRTAVAIAETGGIGQASGRDFTIKRPDGGAVSRFGMAMSLLQVPAAWLAPRVEAAAGPGGSQAIFLLVPWLAVGFAGAFAGWIAQLLGAGPRRAVAAVALATIASPLGSYAFLEFSEPVQAAALSAGLWAALASTTRHGRSAATLQILAGFAVGAAVLTKSSLILAAPWVLLPLIDPTGFKQTRSALGRAAFGAAIPLGIWAIFEVSRFGAFFGGYPDDRFTHPWWDGLWRLVAGPNRGLLLFWPALVLFALAAKLWRGHWKESAAARAWLGACLALLTQVAVAAGYWGWHGMEGWGPRLILSAVPLLAPFAVVAPVARWTLPATVLVCFAVNLPPLIQHPTPVATYIMNLRWPEIPETERWRYPFYATSASERGRPTVIPFELLEQEASANPWRLYLWFWRTSRLDASQLAAALQQPPWADARPDLVPAAPWPPSVARQIAPPVRVGFLGRSVTGTGGPYATAYLDALLDQVIRANQEGSIARALELSARRVALRADGEATAWQLESLRRADRAYDAESLLRSLPAGTREHPLINAVLALFDRDQKEEQRARALLGSVITHFPGTPAETAIREPLDRWPATLDALTTRARRDAIVGR